MLIVMIVVQLLAPFTVGIGEKNKLVVQTNKAEAGDNCNFVDFNYIPSTTKDIVRPDKVILTIETKDCIGNFFGGYIKSDSGFFLMDFGLNEIANDTFSFEINTGEISCNASGDCNSYLDIYLSKLDASGKQVTLVKSTEKTGTGAIGFKCTTENPNKVIYCDSRKTWSIASSQGLFQPENWSINTPVSEKNAIKVSGLGPIQLSNPFTDKDTLTLILYKTDDKSESGRKIFNIGDIRNNNSIQYSYKFENLTSATSYYLNLIDSRQNKQEMLNIVTLNESGQAIDPNPEGTGNRGTTQNTNPGDIVPACITGLFNVHIDGCIAQILYYLVFKPTSALFAITGKLLDVSIGYSVKDTSYRSMFVVEGWKLIKDICNMFFIFVLLYIAFGTILNLNSVKTKEMIINVVIIGLLINFSLFATQVIIDASNILTRVFYNESALVVGENGLNDNVVTSKTGDFGEIRLSEAIVTKIGPQKIILEATKVGDMKTANSINVGDESASKKGVSTWTFILVTVLASAVNIVGLIVFLSVSLIFIARVIGLWLAMVFAPLAFFSYIVPQMQDMAMVGWKKWWPDTIKMAFLAPVFLFFMYLIIKFLGIMGVAVFDANSKTGMDFVVAIMIPFALVMVLMWKAKSIATDMSGEIGKAIVNAAKKVGGVALGAAGGLALGGLAMGARATVGRMGNKLATSKFASTNGAVGRQLGNLGKWAGSGSMDIRGAKIGGKSLADTGIKFGKAKEGGYAKHLEEKVEKRQKRAGELEVHESEDLKQKLNKTEKDLQGLLATNKAELDELDKTIESKRQALTDANAVHGVGSDQSKEIGKALEDAQRRRKEIRTGQKITKKTRKVEKEREVDSGLIDASGKKIISKQKYTEDEEYEDTENDDAYSLGTYKGTDGKEYRRTIDNIERVEIKDRKVAIENENRTRRNKYAKEKAWWGGRANKEAEHKIIMGTKIESKK